MSSISIKIPKGYAEDVDPIDSDDAALEALRQGVSITEISRGVIRNEVGIADGFKRLFLNVTRLWRYERGTEHTIQRKARAEGLLSERAGYTDDAKALQNRYELKMQRGFREAQTAARKLDELGQDGLALAKEHWAECEQAIQDDRERAEAD